MAFLYKKMERNSKRSRVTEEKFEDVKHSDEGFSHGSSDEDENDEDNALGLNVTEDGRIICGGTLNYDFQSFPNMVSISGEELAAVVHDCDVVFNIRAKRDRSGYSLVNLSLTVS